ncbi:MAG: hypothetical protein NZL90_05370, partial [Aquificaceae bacterium]|nr:hypothetical protein [Aquificaceae bacterium]
FSLGMSETKDCSNPLKNNQFCKIAWSLCKSVALRRLNALSECIKQSKSHEEASACFDRPLFIDLLPLTPPK